MKTDITSEDMDKASEAYWKAIKIIKGRFPSGEKDIAKDPELAFAYAKHVIKGRASPVIEEAIAKDPELAYEYARDFIKAPSITEVIDEIGLLVKQVTLGLDEVQKALDTMKILLDKRA